MENQSNGKATASLILGIISIAAGVVFGIYGGIIGLICGIISIVLGVKAKKESPSGMATAGFVLGIVGTVVCALVITACACLVGAFSSAAASGNY